nr:uncharacterized protein LOC113811517 [Penaeus vannamei]
MKVTPVKIWRQNILVNNIEMLQAHPWRRPWLKHISSISSWLVATSRMKSVQNRSTLYIQPLRWLWLSNRRDGSRQVRTIPVLNAYLIASNRTGIIQYYFSFEHRSRSSRGRETQPRGYVLMQ